MKNSFTAKFDTVKEFGYKQITAIPSIFFNDKAEIIERIKIFIG